MYKRIQTILILVFHFQRITEIEEDEENDIYKNVKEDSNILRLVFNF